jgi:copper(I)-binding protein
MNLILAGSRVRAAAVVLTAWSLAATGVAVAQDYQLKSLHIDHPFARATPPGATSGGAYLTLQNLGATADKLVSVHSPAAGAVQIHTMSMDGGVMRMRETPGLDLPPGATVALKPGGYHLMLLDLKHPLAAGDKLPLTLTFEHAGSIDVMVPVEAMGATNAMVPTGGMGTAGDPAHH